MRNLLTAIHWKLVALAAAAVLLAACGGGRTKTDLVQAANIPTSFDVTILADKDNQFDYDGAPLTPEDLKGAFRYRQEESLPMATVLLKRGEKQKIKKEHLASLARIAHQMHFTAFVEESNGLISELQANIKDADSDSAQ
jgi:hypothetical protein